MAMRARACNALSILPLLDLTAAVEAHGESIPVTDHTRYAGPVRCELALEHKGSHCEFVSALACEALSGGADPQACYLIVDHPREHSWEAL